MAAPSWQPDQAGLQQIVGLLTEFQKPGTDQAQVWRGGWDPAGLFVPEGSSLASDAGGPGGGGRRQLPLLPGRGAPPSRPPTGGPLCGVLSAPQVLSVLEQCKAFPDFNAYLAYIFASGEGLAVEVRQGAGLLLKNNLRAGYVGVSAEFRSFIKAALLGVLGHASRPLRHTAGTCVVAIVGLEGLRAWPELVAAAGQALESGDASRAEGALDTLYKLAEEQPRELQPQETGPAGEPAPAPIDPLVPPIMALVRAEERAAGVQALACIIGG